MEKNWDIIDSLELRQEMVKNQIQNRGISDSEILRVFTEVPRHLFIPNVSLDDAYGDFPIPIKAGQTISQPFIVALMISYLDLNRGNEILEIGSGSGYATALMSKLCQHVDSLEVYEDLISDSRKILNQLELSNISITHRSAWEQMHPQKVYDRIILWACPPRIPQHLFDCLVDGGTVVTPEGKHDQYIWVYRKNNNQIKKERRDAVRFVPLVQGSAEEIDRH